jgi:hypothetical protein
VADGWCWFVLREEYCWLVVDGWFVLRVKYCWLVADKPSEQAEKDCGSGSTSKTWIVLLFNFLAIKLMCTLQPWNKV